MPRKIGRASGELTELFSKRLNELLDKKYGPGRGRDANFARDMQVKTPIVSAWINGHNKPDDTKLKQIRELLGVSYSVLLGLSDIDGQVQDKAETKKEKEVCEVMQRENELLKEKIKMLEAERDRYYNLLMGKQPHTTEEQRPMKKHG